MTWPLRAKVRGGRIVLDEPVDLPEGSEVDLVPMDDGDELDPDDRERLHEALRRGRGELDQGLGIPANQFLRELRRSPDS